LVRTRREGHAFIRAVGLRRSMSCHGDVLPAIFAYHLSDERHLIKLLRE
jgi:hypothetical protein